MPESGERVAELGRQLQLPGHTLAETDVAGFTAEKDQPVEEPSYEIVELPIERLLAGDRLAAHIRTESGTLILAMGEEITQAHIEKLRNLRKIKRLTEPVYVQRPSAKAAKVLG